MNTWQGAFVKCAVCSMQAGRAKSKQKEKINCSKLCGILVGSHGSQIW